MERTKHEKTPFPFNAPDLSSEELALHARSGYQDCFEELVRRHGESLKGFLRRRGTNASDAEDVAQESFAKAHEKLSQFNPRFRFSTWLFTIARNIAFRKTREEEPQEEPLEEGADEESPFTKLQEKEKRESLWAAAERALPAAQLETLSLMYAKGLSVAEIAARTGRTKGNVKTLLHRARLKLAGELRRNAEREGS